LWTVPLMSKKMLSMLLIRDFAVHLSCIFRSRWVWTFPVRLMLIWSLLGSLSQFFRDWHNIWCILVVGPIAKSHLARYTTPNKRTWKISTSTQLRDFFYTDSQDIQVLSSAVSSCYFNCCTDGSTSP
jgi:hypothetical protein